MKGVNALISFALLTAMALAAIFLVVNIASPVIEGAQAGETMMRAEAAMIKIDNAVREVAQEGEGSRRIIKLHSPGELETLPEEDLVQFSSRLRVQVIEFLSRKTEKNLLYIGGNDVVCDSSANLTIENSFFRAVLNKITNATPLSALNTRNNIISITEKETNTQINVTNSTIVIDDNATYASGTGYSELLRSGKGLPSCTAHFFVNASSARSYDIYYTLYAGADFLVVRVRNVR